MALKESFNDKKKDKLASDIIVLLTGLTGVERGLVLAEVKKHFDRVGDDGKIYDTERDRAAAEWGYRGSYGHL